MSDKHVSLRVEIEHAINRCSAESGSNTPDFILARFLTDCLEAFDTAVTVRTAWYAPPTPKDAAVAARAPHQFNTP